MIYTEIIDTDNNFDIDGNEIKQVVNQDYINETYSQSSYQKSNEKTFSNESEKQLENEMNIEIEESFKSEFQKQFEINENNENQFENNEKQFQLSYDKETSTKTTIIYKSDEESKYPKKVKQKPLNDEKNRINQRQHQQIFNIQSYFLKYLMTTIGFTIDIQKPKRKATKNGNKLIINSLSYFDEKGNEITIKLDELMEQHIGELKTEMIFTLEEQRIYSFNLMKELLIYNGFEVLERKLYKNNTKGFVMSPSIIESITIPDYFIPYFPQQLHFSGVITREKMENSVDENWNEFLMKV